MAGTVVRVTEKYVTNINLYDEHNYVVFGGP